MIRMIGGLCLFVLIASPAAAQSPGAARTGAAQPLIVCGQPGCRTFNIPSHCKITQLGGVGRGNHHRVDCRPRQQAATGVTQPAAPPPRTTTSSGPPGERRIFCGHMGCRAVMIPPNCRLVQFGGIGHGNFGRRICHPPTVRQARA